MLSTPKWTPQVVQGCIELTTTTGPFTTDHVHPRHCHNHYHGSTSYLSIIGQPILHTWSFTFTELQDGSILYKRETCHALTSIVSEIYKTIWVYGFLIVHNIAMLQVNTDLARRPIICGASEVDMIVKIFVFVA